MCGSGCVREHATVNLPMQLAGSTTQVEVTAAGALTNPDRTSFGTTLDNNATRNLPLVSRNLYNFILFQPNVSGIANTEFGVPRKIDANGFNGRINYEIDGGNAHFGSPYRPQSLAFSRRCAQRLAGWIIGNVKMGCDRQAPKEPIRTFLRIRESP